MKEQKLSPRYRKFAELLVRGETAKAAYAACFPGCLASTAEVGGSRLQRKPAVVALVARLQAELAEKVAGETVVTVKEALEFLTEIIRTPAGQVDEGHRLCQCIKQTPHYRLVKLPCKIRAVELAMKLQGFLNDKVKHEVTDTLQDFLLELRAGGAE